MAENSGIAWTTHTFNPWIGCTKVSAGCRACYAENLMDTRYKKAQWGPNGTRVLTSPGNWAKPLKWNKEAAAAGTRVRVFCASLADVFEDWMGPVHNHKGEVLATFGGGYRPALAGDDFCRATLDDIRRDLFALIDATPNLDWLLLTKRPENIRRMWVHPNDTGTGFESLTRKRYNVWLGTSVAVQADADKNIPELLQCRNLSPVLWVSAEPMLGKIDLRNIPTTTKNDEGGFYSIDALEGSADSRTWDGRIVWGGLSKLDWIIPGCESAGQQIGSLGEFADGDAWLAGCADLVAQCKTAGVPAFVKQVPIGGKLSHDPAEWPEGIRVREFPKTPAHAGQETE